MAKFNISLLAKQGCRILNNPNSLVSRVLKAKYFPETDFLNSYLGNNSSFAWKSIWAARGVLLDGSCWKVGRGTAISAIHDSWLPDYPKLSSHFTNYPRLSHLQEFKVADLIEDRIREWKKELIEATFPVEISEKIFCIPLAKEPHDDFLVWREESSGEFTVRSAYKLLQSSENDPSAYALQNDSRNFYRNLWLLNLPLKVKILVWKISWNYIPTRVNLNYRRLLNNVTCVGYGSAAESANHIFRECPGFLNKIPPIGDESFVALFGQYGENGIGECMKRLIDRSSL